MSSQYYKQMSEAEFREAVKNFTRGGYNYADIFQSFRRSHRMNDETVYVGADAAAPHMDQTHINVDGHFMAVTSDMRRVWYKGRLVYERRT